MGAGSLLLLLFVCADYYWPLPDPQRMQSVIVLAEDQTPLRAFADEQGVWRYPVQLDEVSPLYIEALLTYEDRWFYQHPGVNPLAMLRAGWQWLRYGRVISGGSTVTMQVARILDPHPRTIRGKLQQIFRALQLEWHYSKTEILTFYLNLAPFGGPIEGVETASIAWLHKPSVQISHAEAALLAVLPQSPSRLRLDRYPERAQRYRDKVLRRMQTLGVWPADVVEDALRETVFKARFQQPMMAPLFARRMKEQAQQQQLARIGTALDINAQWAVENILQARQGRLPKEASVGVLVMENKTGYVRAYAGSVDFFSQERSGHVDMVQAVRSPGSTLKPFLYGMALDEGLIHSASLLSDVPRRVGEYAPKNFFQRFSGAVSASHALQQSLNVPAIDLLQRLSAQDFVARLRQGGIALQFPEQAEPNLSVILGGAGTRLEDLVRGFSALARAGISITPRLVPEDNITERYMLSAGAAWIIQHSLLQIPPPEGHINARNIAWKTGTSYGFRDAWAVGVNADYTIGVWVGRPDGTPLPGYFGGQAAAPLLFDIFHALSYSQQVITRPATVRPAAICWPLGREARSTALEHCHVQQNAWLLDDQDPPTLPDLLHYSWSAKVQTYWLNPLTGLRVTAACGVSTRQRYEVANWPLAVRPWLPHHVLAQMQLPPLDSSCPAQLHFQDTTLAVSIRNLDTSTRLYLPQTQLGEVAAVTIDLQADGGQGQYYWLVNGEAVGVDRNGAGLRYRFVEAGDYELTVFDATGSVDHVLIQVVASL